MQQLQKLADDNARAGRIVPDTQAEALRRWREDHDLHDLTGINKQEAERS
jgi:hypothetical protein